MIKENVDAISVKYLYSACIKTTTPNVRILHDPWFSEGVYDGSWFHFPKITDPLMSVGDCDIVYVSHIHPDHYDGKWLKAYFKKYGKKKVIIADHTPNHLAGKMRADGIDATILSEPMRIKSTTVEILPHKTGSISDVDSAIIVKYQDTNNRTHCVVNANDIIFDEEMRLKLKNSAGEVDILLCGYTGAGPYPQTYFNLEDADLILQASNKKLAFFERYKRLVSTIKAKRNIPFAGKYVLGGKLCKLNSFRGVADPVEVIALDSNALVLEDNGGEIDTQRLKPSATRTQLYSSDQINQRINEIKDMKMDYERLMPESEIHQLPLKRLLNLATRNAVAKSECSHDYFFCIKIGNEEYAVINANKQIKPTVTYAAQDVLPIPRSEIYIDPRYLFGLLTHIYHWNNAEIGSQYNTRRYPNALDRKAQLFLNYLAV
jgi:UDP-MurNAc hydroxylase